MMKLQNLAQQDPYWSLAEFVQMANQLLPQFLPDEKAHTRVREDVTPRLIRHYTSQGLIDEPLKDGREARYRYRHLLQVLLVRRLLTEGYGASVIHTLVPSKQNSELEALLQGGVQLTLAPANPALAFLQKVQTRQTQRSLAKRSSLPEPSLSNVGSSLFEVSSSEVSSPDSPTHWMRQEVLPGLELHVRHDFVLPATAQEQQNLLHHLLKILTTLVSSKRKDPDL
jgi:DNA-binding transcriptional MerR regulator